jgi:hypothetical protein
VLFSLDFLRCHSIASYSAFPSIFPLRRGYTLVSISLCRQNHCALAVHSGLVDAHSNSKWRSTCGTNLLISIKEMFLPMHVREPWPNWKQGSENGQSK